ncbi:MAG: thiosulfate/3-mercaptopyruvate sulfurtransferase [Thermoanaerobaculia bacterium]|jgi:thiosulfate/3-mercaptopyruvate sulfurtransferase|nr:thiosulfate/3-mercaptopyruvate sulfurtransferase [Thermoanaerobaculia bacterium]
MQLRTLIRCTFLFTALAASTLIAASQRQSLVVSADWLKQHIADSDLVLLHVGDKAGYEVGHIPGARLTSLADISISDHTEKGLMLEMPPAEELRHKLEALGISDKSRVIVYYGKDWVSPSTRVLFTLDYAGLGARSSLLDGGQAAWVSAGGPLTKDVTATKTGSLAPLQIRPIVVDADTVKSRIGAPGFAIVDGRDAVYYDGVETGQGHNEKHRTGHIHGALSIPFTSITDDRLLLKSNEELAALFAKAGVKANDTVIGYCHIGQQTTAMLFAARTLGHPVLLYDGSFQDWSRHAGYPVDNPSEKASK